MDRIEGCGRRITNWEPSCWTIWAKENGSYSYFNGSSLLERMREDVQCYAYHKTAKGAYCGGDNAFERVRPVAAICHQCMVRFGFLW